MTTFPDPKPEQSWSVTSQGESAASREQAGGLDDPPRGQGEGQVGWTTGDLAGAGYGTVPVLQVSSNFAVQEEGLAECDGSDRTAELWTRCGYATRNAPAPGRPHFLQLSRPRSPGRPSFQMRTLVWPVPMGSPYHYPKAGAPISPCFLPGHWIWWLRPGQNVGARLRCCSLRPRVSHVPPGAWTSHGQVSATPAPRGHLGIPSPSVKPAQGWHL